MNLIDTIKGSLLENFFPAGWNLAKIDACVGKPGEEPSWGRWFRQVEARVHHGTTVMSGDRGEPLLVLDRVGKGRVAQLLSDQAWLWARGFEGGGPQAELLRRVAHWLMQEPELEENALTAHVADGRLAIERRSTDPAPPVVAPRSWR